MPPSDCPSVDGLAFFAHNPRQEDRTAFLAAMVKYVSQPLSNLDKSNAIAVLKYFYLEHPAEGVQHMMKESQDLAQSAARLKSAATMLAKKCPPYSLGA